MHHPREADVVVIGAGLAGLAAAEALASQGRHVTVWEARDRLGGRTETTRVHGLAVDLGAQWLGPAQHRMHDLARRFGLATFPTHTEGRALVVDGDRTHRYRGTVPLLGPLQLGRMGLALRRIQRMAAAAGPLPGGEDDAAAMDDRTLAEVLDGPLGRGAARRVVDTAIRVIFGEEPAALSARWVAAYAAAAGGDLLALAAIEGGAQQTRLLGGTQAFAQALAAEVVSAEGCAVELGRVVASVAQDDHGVTVTATSGAQVRAVRAVVAVPTPLVGSIAFDPPLPASRSGLQQRMPMGATAKVFAFYDEAFWRAEGLRGEAVLTTGPVQVTFDVSGPAGTPPALLAFVTGAAAQQMASMAPAARDQAVVDALGRAFGPRATRPTAVVSRHWLTEPFTRGCPVANLVPGAMTPFGPALHAPVGRLHWAGTEAAGDWTGYMEGAVASGRQAALEVLRRW